MSISFQKISLLLLSLFFFSCAHGGATAGYPEHWWTPVPKEGAPDWEILPQDAKSGEVILSKRNELGILSNFAATSFTMDGVKYASVEGFWQMMKYPEDAKDVRNSPAAKWAYTRDQVAAMTAFEAKKAGSLAEANMKALGIDWVTYKGEKMVYKSMVPGRHYELILQAMKLKLQQNPEVKRILLSTKPLILKPDHTQSADSPPEWKYYEVWMNLRDELTK